MPIARHELGVYLPYALALVERAGFPAAMTESAVLEAVETFGLLAEVSISEALAGNSLTLPSPVSLDPTLTNGDDGLVQIVKGLLDDPEFIAAINRSNRPQSNFLDPGSPLPLRNVPLSDRGKTTPVVGGYIAPERGGEILGGLPADLVPQQYRAWLALAAFGIRAARSLVQKWRASRG